MTLFPVELTNPGLLIHLPEFWFGLVGLPFGLAIGLVLRTMINFRQIARWRLYASLWEWARQQPAAGGGRVHAARIQRYYRKMRRYQQPERQLAAAMVGLSLAILLLLVSSLFLAPQAYLSGAVLVGGLSLLIASLGSLLWAPLGLLLGLVGLIALAWGLVCGGGSPLP